VAARAATLAASACGAARLTRCRSRRTGGGGVPGRQESSGRAQVCRLVSHPVVKRDFAALLAGGEGDKRQVAALADLLERLTALDPDRRGPAPA